MITCSTYEWNHYAKISVLVSSDFTKSTSQWGCAVCACSSQREEDLSSSGPSLAQISSFLSDWILLRILKFTEATGWFIQEAYIYLVSGCFKDCLRRLVRELIWFAMIFLQSRIQISHLGQSIPWNHRVTRLLWYHLAQLPWSRMH